MVGVVQTNADEFADLADAGAYPWLTGNDGQAGRIDGGKRCQAFRAEGQSGDVRYMRREVADLIIGIQQARFFRTFFAITQQFHLVLLLKPKVRSGFQMLMPPSMTCTPPVV
ncbi:hypothetical protein D3C84_276420 [compost metagenome]